MLSILLAQVTASPTPAPTPTPSPPPPTFSLESSEIAKNGVEVGIQIQEATRDTFHVVLDSQLFTAVQTVAIFFALMFLGWTAISAIRPILLGGGASAPASLEGVIGAILICLFLANPTNSGGGLMQKTLYGMNDLLYGVGQYIAAGAATAVSPGGSVYQEAVTKSQVQTGLGEYTQKCNSILDIDERKTCFADSYKRLTQLLKPYEARNWAIGLQSQLNTQLYNPAVDGSQDSGYGGNFGDEIKRELGNVFNSTKKVVSQAGTLAVGWSATGLLFICALVCGMIIESVKVLMCVMAPLTWALSLLPPLRDSWFSWMLGFFKQWLISYTLSLLISINSIYLLASNADGIALPIATALISIFCCISSLTILVSTGSGIQRNIASVVVSR